MIESCTGWKCGDALYPLLRDAQKAALEGIIGENLAEGIRGDIAGLLIGRKEDVIKVLSLAEPKERKTRADKGSKRTRKIAPVATGKPQVNPPEVIEDANRMEPLPKYKGK